MKGKSKTTDQELITKRKEKTLYYHDLGLNNNEIAKLVDCSRENVRQILELFGKKSPVCFKKNREEEYA